MASLATIAEFEDRIPGGISSADTARAQAMLDDASALIRDEAGTDFATSVPDAVKTICMSAAKRAFLNPDAVRGMSIDGNSVQLANASPDVYLTKAETRTVRRAAGKLGLWTQSTTRTDGDDEFDGTGAPDTPSVILDIIEPDDHHFLP